MAERAAAHYDTSTVVWAMRFDRPPPQDLPTLTSPRSSSAQLFACASMLRPLSLAEQALLLVRFGVD